MTPDIHDIRGPKFIMPWWLIPAGAAALLLVAVLGWALVHWWKGRHGPRVLLPFQVALGRLQAIRALMEPATAREFSTAVSDIVRSYIEQRFLLTATHLTTEEFLRDLLASSHASLVQHRALLSEFLHQCDLVKFAGVSLTLENMESLHQSARVFVMETSKPEPTPKTAEATTEASAERPAAAPPSTLASK